MAATTKAKKTSNKIDTEADLLIWIQNFLIDRKAQGLSPGTMRFYEMKLATFASFCRARQVDQITQITPDHIREYMIFLQETGHNPGGKHAFYRVIRTFLYWWEEEIEPEDWSNPIRKAKPPKLPVMQLEPVSMEDIKALIATCDKSFHGLRDKAILLTLLDTGVRASELIDMKLANLDLNSGEIVIEKGKGSKSRTVFLGRTSRKATRAYLRARTDECPYLWVTAYGDPLTYFGLRGVTRRRALEAGLPIPSLHSFRRAFALNMLRSGVDVFSIQKLMGHADLQVLRRYLAQTTEDIAQAHRIGSPVDNNISK